MTTITHLECAACGKRHEAGQLHNLCECGGPLLVRYDLDKLREGWSREWIPSGPTSMWRYAPVLPVSKPAAMISLGEGMTPLVHTKRLGARLGSEDLWVKDEGVNPTGSFKARGLSCAVSMCVELGVKKVAIPSAGNAAGAMAAYAAAAGIEAHIFMPRDVPQANYIECCAAGAHVTLVDGLISDCAKIVMSRKDQEGWFDVSTLKEPYRIEGKKTMGYEVAEQFRWQLPDAIFYPCGGGVGLIGMWKAFAEMEALGWITSKRPKMIAVQAEGCAPIVKAFEEGKIEERVFRARGDGGERAAGSEGAGRFSGARRRAAERRNVHRGERRGNDRGRRGAGDRRRNFRGSGGRSLRGGVEEAAGQRVSEGAGADRDLQHGEWAEISGSLFAGVSQRSFKPHVSAWGCVSQPK